MLLAGAISCEVVATLSLKAALNNPALYLIVALGYLCSFAFFTAVLKAGMGLGVAYGIWGSVGVAGVAVVSAVLFEETLSAGAWIGIGLVIAGVLVVDLGQDPLTSPVRSPEVD